MGPPALVGHLFAEPDVVLGTCTTGKHLTCPSPGLPRAAELADSQLDSQSGPQVKGHNLLDELLSSPEFLDMAQAVGPLEGCEESPHAAPEPPLSEDEYQALLELLQASQGWQV